jgi:hypothetical protein
MGLEAMAAAGNQEASEGGHPYCARIETPNGVNMCFCRRVGGPLVNSWDFERTKLLPEDRGKRGKLSHGKIGANCIRRMLMWGKL